jgi:hypothetical protein
MAAENEGAVDSAAEGTDTAELFPVDALDEARAAAASIMDDFGDEHGDALNDDAVGTTATDAVDGEIAEALNDTADESEQAAAGEKPRDDKGRFVPKPDAAPAPAAGEKPAATATDPAKPANGPAPAAGTAAAPAAAAAAPEPPKWEKVQVKADKATFDIEEAQLTRANGHHLYAIKDADVPRFQQRLSKGIVAERMWRELNDSVKAIEAERAAPQPKSPEQIEAEVILATLKPRLAELYDDPKDIELLQLRIKEAQRDYQDKFKTERIAYDKKIADEAAKATQPEVDQKAQLEGLATTMFQLVDRHPELQGLTREQLQEVYNELVPIRKAAYWKEDGQWYADTQLIHSRIAAKKAGTSSQAAASSSAPSKEPPAAASPSAGTSAAGAAGKPDAGERFNAAQDTAAKPRSTNLKLQRDAGRPSETSTTGATRGNGNGRGSQKTPAQIAEDKARATARRYLSSDTLDFEEPDD